MIAHQCRLYKRWSSSILCATRACTSSKSTCCQLIRQSIFKQNESIVYTKGEAHVDCISYITFSEHFSGTTVVLNLYFCRFVSMIGKANVLMHDALLVTTVYWNACDLWRQATTIANQQHVTNCVYRCKRSRLEGAYNPYTDLLEFHA